jgi:hypothetical protein
MVMHYNPASSPVPPGYVDEPFHAAACRRGCADAIARGVAKGVSC